MKADSTAAPEGLERPDRFRVPWGLLAAVALLGLAGCAAPGLELQPARWDLGLVGGDAPIQTQLTVRNVGRRSEEVHLFTTCPCLTVQPDVLRLPPGGSGEVQLHYDPSGDEGEVAMQVIARTGGGPGRRSTRRVVPVSGRVLAAAAAGGERAERESPSSPPDRPLLVFEYFYDPGCKGCELFLARQLIALQQELGVRLVAERRDIREQETRSAYLRLLESLGMEERAYPAVVFGEAVLQGDQEIQQRLGDLVRSALEPRGQEGRP